MWNSDCKNILHDFSEKKGRKINYRKWILKKKKKKQSRLLQNSEPPLAAEQFVTPRTDQKVAA